MENKFDFEFDLDQRVVTPFGHSGLITMLGFDDGGRKYYVQTATNSDWFKESQIEKQEIGLCPVGDFLDTVCEVDESCKVPTTEMYAAFAEYCQGNDYPLMSLKGFTRKMVAHGKERVNHGGSPYWLGVRLPKAT